VTSWPGIPGPPEPLAWRRDHREAPAAGTLPPELVEKVAGAWWVELAPILAPAGLDRRWLVQVVSGYGRELWLWLVGDRSWPQVAQGLVGRLGRRLPPEARCSSGTPPVSPMPGVGSPMPGAGRSAC